MSTTVVTTPAPSAPASAGAESTSLRWRSEGFVFELVSSDTDVLRQANAVFASPRETSVNANVSWTIGSSETADGERWTVTRHRDPDGRMQSEIRESRESALLFVENEVLDFLIAHSNESIAVHCALLAKEGRGIVIVGPSLAGKTTLAITLWRSGWTLMADDTAFLHPLVLTASPAPRRVSARKESRVFVGDKLWNEMEQTPSFLRTEKGLFFHPHEVDATSPLISTPIASIFFLARSGVSLGAAVTSRLNTAKAAVALLPYGFNLRTVSFMEGILRITSIVEAVPAYDIGRGDLSAMVQAVEQHVG
ncbi:MAG: hypothetical protein ABI556_12950 [Gemmatimonadales bacterium]